MRNPDDIKAGLELSSELLRAIADFNEALVFTNPTNMKAARVKLKSRSDALVKFTEELTK